MLRSRSRHFPGISEFQAWNTAPVAVEGSHDGSQIGLVICEISASCSWDLVLHLIGTVLLLLRTLCLHVLWAAAGTEGGGLAGSAVLHCPRSGFSLQTRAGGSVVPGTWGSHFDLRFFQVAVPQMGLSTCVTHASRELLPFSMLRRAKPLATGLSCQMG